MYVHAMEGSWIDTPFWRQSLLLEDLAAVEALRRSPIAHITIDESRGVKALPLAQTFAIPAHLTHNTPHKCVRQRSSLPSDIQRTQATMRKALSGLRGMFEDVRQGGYVPLESVGPVLHEIELSVERSPKTLIALTRLKTRDEATFIHSIAVSALMLRFGQHLTLEKQTISLLGMAGLLHDLGKTALPTALLTKAGTLTAEEMTLIRTHPQRGFEMLTRKAGMPDLVLDVCLHHHERLDGKGYPRGLEGKAISVPARIAAICDVYDALTSVRSYKPAWTQKEAFSKMQDWAGHFDPLLLKEFVQCLQQ